MAASVLGSPQSRRYVLLMRLRIALMVLSVSNPSWMVFDWPLYVTLVRLWNKSWRTLIPSVRIAMTALASEGFGSPYLSQSRNSNVFVDRAITLSMVRFLFFWLAICRLHGRSARSASAISSAVYLDLKRAARARVTWDQLP